MNLGNSYLINQAISLVFVQYIVTLIKMVEIQIGELGYWNYLSDQSIAIAF